MKFDAVGRQRGTSIHKQDEVSLVRPEPVAGEMDGLKRARPLVVLAAPTDQMGWTKRLLRPRSLSIDR